MKRAVSKVAKEIGDLIDRWDGFAETLQGRARDIVVPRETLARWLLTLCPPKAGLRKIRTQSAVRAARRTTRKQLDAMCRDIVFLRDGNKCRRCGRTSGKMDWSHVFPKGAHPWLRWDLDNSKVLCANCHLQWWHGHPLEAHAWWENEIGPEKWKALVLRAAKPRRIDPMMVKLYLEKAMAA